MDVSFFVFFKKLLYNTEDEQVEVLLYIYQKHLLCAEDEQVDVLLYIY